jgi:hypothetical protein
MTKRDQVRAAIIKAVPEIVELKFGCQIKRFENTVDTVVKIESFADGKHVAHLVKADGDPLSYGPRTIDIENWKILGRPIRLADVLVAIEEAHKYRSDYEGRRVAIELVVATYEGGYFTRDRYWNLRADSLDDQSPKCIEFLHSILCG